MNSSCRYQSDGELKYLTDAQELIRPERNTLSVNFEDVERHNTQLATTILEDYYRYGELLLIQYVAIP